MKKKGIFLNWHIKLICFFLAVATVYFFSFALSNKRTVTLPLSVVLPDSGTYKAVSNIPKSVKVVIQGSENLIYMVNVEKLKLVADFSNVNHEGVSSVPVQIDLKSAGDLIDFSKLTLYTEPSQVRVYFEAL